MFHIKNKTCKPNHFLSFHLLEGLGTERENEYEKCYKNEHDVPVEFDKKIKARLFLIPL